MNYKNIIIIMLLYILYTTYAASNNKELFIGSLFGSAQPTSVSNPFEKKAKKNSLMANSMSFLNNLLQKTTHSSYSQRSRSTSNASNSLSFFAKKRNSVETFSSNNSNNSNTSENFTPQEMKLYPQMLKKNCDMTSSLHKKLQKNNNKRCGAKGKTDRDTINNKRLCWDDVRKEIVTGMDAESNCVMASLNANKIGSDTRADMAEMKFPSRTATKSTPVSSYDVNRRSSTNVEIDAEGPDFINRHYTGLFDPSKGAGFAEIGAEQKGKTGKYADINSYTDVGFTSDPAFLYRLSVYNNNKTKSKAEQFEEYNNQQMNTKINPSNGDAYDMAGRLKPDYFN